MQKLSRCSGLTWIFCVPKIWNRNQRFSKLQGFMVSLNFPKQLCFLSNSNINQISNKEKQPQRPFLERCSKRQTVNTACQTTIQVSWVHHLQGKKSRCNAPSATVHFHAEAFRAAWRFIFWVERVAMNGVGECGKGCQGCLFGRHFNEGVAVLWFLWSKVEFLELFKLGWNHRFQKGLPNSSFLQGL